MMTHHTHKPDKTPEKQQPAPKQPTPPEPESGGPQGPEPTRYGDWERGGIVSDF